MKLTLEEQDILKDSKEALPVVLSLLESFLERRIKGILTESLDDDGKKLVLARMKYDGMRELINEFRNYITSK